MANSAENNAEYTEQKTDCEVCRMLIKEKHKNDYIWKIFCIIFLALAIIFAILYFGHGAFTTETNIKIGEDAFVGNSVEGGGSIEGNVIVGSDGTITGTVERTDYTPIICICIMVAAVILVIGGIIIANHYKKDN